jgi:SHS2 domain-containing protein
MMMRYENLEHTADVMIKAYGSSLKECFENAAYGMIDQIVDASSVVPRQEERIEVEADNLEDLLYNFLSEVLFIFDAKHIALVEFDVDIQPGKLSCRARGEKFDRERHGPKQEIKAVTYHMLQVNEQEPSITVLFDV